MNKSRVLAMEAGDKLDAFVAKEIMGLEISYLGTRYASVMVGPGIWAHPAYYSTNTSAAWQVVEKMLPLCAQFILIKNEMLRLRWQATFILNDEMMTHGYAEAEAAPEAICKAALLAKLEGGKYG